MKNPIKMFAIINLVLLVGLICVILFLNQKTESGEKIGYFLKKDDETDASATSPTSPTA